MPNAGDILYEPIRMTWARKCLQRPDCDEYVKSYPSQGDGQISGRYTDAFCEYCGRTIIGRPLD
jgi:hypothetical protein